MRIQSRQVGRPCGGSGGPGSHRGYPCELFAKVAEDQGGIGSSPISLVVASACVSIAMRIFGEALASERKERNMLNNREYIQKRVKSLISYVIHLGASVGSNLCAGMATTALILSHLINVHEQQYPT